MPRVEGRRKGVFLVFSAPFWLFLDGFEQNVPSLRLEPPSGQPPVSLLVIALPAVGIRKYHPFHCWSVLPVQGRLFLLNGQKGEN